MTLTVNLAERPSIFQSLPGDFITFKRFSELYESFRKQHAIVGIEIFTLMRHFLLSRASTTAPEPANHEHVALFLGSGAEVERNRKRTSIYCQIPERM